MKRQSETAPSFPFLLFSSKILHLVTPLSFFSPPFLHGQNHNRRRTCEQFRLFFSFFFSFSPLPLAYAGAFLKSLSPVPFFSFRKRVEKREPPQAPFSSLLPPRALCRAPLHNFFVCPIFFFFLPLSVYFASKKAMK